MTHTLNRRLLVLLAPFTVVFVIFLLVPLCYGVVLSLSGGPFVISLGNYAEALTDPLFLTALTNTMVYIAGNILLAVLSIAIAILMYELGSQRLIRLYEALMLFPYVIPMVVTGIVFSFIFQPQIGIFVQLLKAFGFHGQYAPLAHSFSAKVVIVVVWVFVYTGYMVNIYTTSLRAIPDSYYAAAQIDGASWLQKSIFITLPLLGNIFVYTIVTGIILSFQIFPLIWILTGSGFGLGAGGPDNGTLSLDLYIYQTAFRDHHLFVASAMGVLMMVVTYAISLLPRRLVTEVTYD